MCWASLCTLPFAATTPSNELPRRCIKIVEATCYYWIPAIISTSILLFKLYAPKGVRALELCRLDYRTSEWGLNRTHQCPCD